MRVPQITRPGRSVSVLAYDGMSAFELGIVTEVFGLPRPELDVPWYDLTVCAQGPGPVRVVGGAFLNTPHGLEVFSAAQTVIVPGVPDVTGDPAPELTAALRLAHRRGRASSPSAPARSRWRPRDCSTDAGPPPTGAMPTCCAAVTPRSTSTRTPSTSTSTT